MLPGAAAPQSIQAQALRHRTMATNVNLHSSSRAPAIYQQDPLGTADDYSALPGYYTSLLSQQTEDVFPYENNLDSECEVMESPPITELNSLPKSKGRSKNFSEDEDILLVSAYLNISKDAIVGRDQKEGRFWERIENYFHDNKTFETDRNASSLKHRWAIIHKEVSVFQAYHEAIERKNESGKTSDDKLAEAKATFHELQKKAFSVFHAWNILRHEPKYATLRASKLDSTNMDFSNVNEEGEPNIERPLGRKAEKEIAKAKKLQKRKRNTSSRIKRIIQSTIIATVYSTHIVH